LPDHGAAKRQTMSRIEQPNYLKKLLEFLDQLEVLKISIVWSATGLTPSWFA
jgi:hypothetical protein